MVLTLFVLALSAGAVDLDVPAANYGIDVRFARETTLRQLVTDSTPDSVDEHYGWQKLVRLGLTFRMSADDVARFESDPNAVSFLPLAEVKFSPFVRLGREKVLGLLHSEQMYLVLDVEKATAKYADVPRRHRFGRFPGLGPATMEQLTEAIEKFANNKRPHFDLTGLAVSPRLAARVDQLGLARRVPEADLLRSGLSLSEVAEVAVALRGCGQLMDQ